MLSLVKDTVKGKRPSRAERARATRRRIIESAATHFTTDGYAPTTMEQIASRSGVAVQTVYYTFGTKGHLLCRAMDFLASGGHEPEPVAQRPWMREAMTTASARRALAIAVEHGVDIFGRAAPLWPAVNAAAAEDPAVEQYWSGVNAERRAGMERLVARIARLGELRPGLTVGTASDILFVLNGHGTFQGLVSEAAWPLVEFKAWLYATLVDQLLAPGDPDPSATTGLSFDGDPPQRS